MKLTYLQVIKQQWKLIISVVIIAAVLSLVLSVIQQPQYRTSTELLIVPRGFSLTSLYDSPQTIDRLGTTFSEVVYTNSFMDAVLTSNAGVKDVFGLTATKRKENWKKAVDSRFINDTGFLQISTYASDKTQSTLLAQAIINVLCSRANDYLGQADAVLVKVVDSPITSDHIARPDIVQNLVLGAILGLLAGVGIAFAFPYEHEINIFDAIKNVRRRELAGAEVEPIFEAPEVGVEPEALSVEAEPAVETTEEKTESTVDSAPNNLPVADVSTPSERIPVKENEPVELSPAEKAEHWLKTGKLLK